MEQVDSRASTIDTEECSHLETQKRMLLASSTSSKPRSPRRRRRRRIIEERKLWIVSTQNQKHVELEIGENNVVTRIFHFFLAALAALPAPLPPGH